MKCIRQYFISTAAFGLSVSILEESNTRYYVRVIKDEDLEDMYTPPMSEFSYKSDAVQYAQFLCYSLKCSLEKIVGVYDASVERLI